MSLRATAYDLIEEQKRQLRLQDPTLSEAEALAKCLSGEKYAAYREYRAAVARGDTGSPKESVFQKTGTVVNDTLADKIWSQLEELAVQRMVEMSNTQDGRSRPALKAEALAAIVAENPDLYRRFSEAKRRGR